MYTDTYAVRELRSDLAYERLKRGLLVGDYPLNVRLGEEKLAAAIGVSRTPVREALLRLHSEELVRRCSDGGYEPVAPDVAVIRNLYEVRAGLEIQALRRPERLGAEHDRRMLRELRVEWQELGEAPPDEADLGFVLMDEAFHVTLAESAGNPALADLLRQVNERIRIVRTTDFLTADRITQTIDEHLAIVEAVLAGHLAIAQARFVSHLDRSVAVVEERVSRAVARMLERSDR